MQYPGTPGTNGTTDPLGNGTGATSGSGVIRTRSVNDGMPFNLEVIGGNGGVGGNGLDRTAKNEAGQYINSRGGNGGHGGAGGIAFGYLHSRVTGLGGGTVGATTIAKGGAGGNSGGFGTLPNLGYGGRGGYGGAATATASAIARAADGSPDAATHAVAEATATGGVGGKSSGVGSTVGLAGMGGTVQGSSAHAVGGSASASVTQNGGGGGDALTGASAGNGADSTLINAVSGQANGGTLVLSQRAEGGQGGRAGGPIGKHNTSPGLFSAGGDAKSLLTFNDLANSTHATNLKASVDAQGGTAGGRRRDLIEIGQTAAGQAEALVNVTGAHTVSAEATARAGHGGGAGASSNFKNNNGQIDFGGSASAKAKAVTTSATATARAVSRAYGGSGGHGHLSFNELTLRTYSYHGGTGGTASGTEAAAYGFSADATARQYGGTGGAGGYGRDRPFSQNGGAGAGSFLVNAVKGATTGGTLTLEQKATGGAGGGTVEGKGGSGGDAQSDLTFDDTANAVDAASVTATSDAFGGGGGTGQTGGAGGSARATLNITAANIVNAKAVATGGHGGLVGGVGRQGGAGASVIGSYVRAAGASANASVLQTGGNGGVGQYGARGGDGGNSTLINAAKGSAAAGTLTLRQTAIGGGGGGISFNGGGGGGSGGAAQSSLMFDDLTENSQPAAILIGTSTAMAGSAGIRALDAASVGGAAQASINLTGAGSVDAIAHAEGGATLFMNAGVDSVAAAGGSATAAAIARTTGLSALATAIATAVGGGGGTSPSDSVSSGAGGLAYGTTARAIGFNARAAAYQTGGPGGQWYKGAVPGGAGAPSTLIHAVSGSAQGGVLTLIQVARGGSGGSSGGLGTGGAGGAAISVLTFNDVATNKGQSSQLVGHVNAFGGAGGASDFASGSVGSAEAKISLTGANIVTANAFSQGGNNNTSRRFLVGYGSDTAGAGATKAHAIAISQGRDTTDTATAVAEARPIIPFNGPPPATDAEAKATAVTANGQDALAEATARSGGGTILAEANAESRGVAGAPTVRARATSTAVDLATATALSRHGATIFAPNTKRAESFVFASARPDASFLPIAMEGRTHVAAVLGTPSAVVFGLAGHGIRNDDPINTQTYAGETTWTLDTRNLSGNLVVGILANSRIDLDNVQDGTTEIQFSVLAGDTTLFDTSFASIGAAQTFLVDRVLDLGAVTQSERLDVTVRYRLTTDDFASGLDLGYLIGAQDMTAPAAPSMPDILAAYDTGLSSTDNITRKTDLIFTGSAEAHAVITLSNGAEQIAIGKANAAGNWSILATGRLVEGKHAITATATDAAGNTSSASTVRLVEIDTTAPSAPSAPDLTATSDSGLFNTDNRTNDATPTFSGTAEGGARVSLFDGGTLVGSGVASAAGDWSITASALSKGSHTIRARAADTAGNSSAVSTGLSVVIDPEAVVPSVPNLSDASDSGSSTTDNITRVVTPSFTGKAEAGATVTLIDGSTVIGTGIAGGAGDWTVTSATLAAGVHAIRARAVDLAGNVSALSLPLSVTVDLIATTPTTPNLTDASDGGTSSTDNVTRVTTPTFSGKAESGASITLFDGVNNIGAGKAGTDGAWSIKAAPLTEGLHAILAQAVDRAGNLSAPSATLTVMIDTTPHSAPGAPDLLATSDSGVSSADNRTNLALPTFRGQADPGAVVTLLSGGATIGAGKANSSGNWQIKTTLLDNGTHAVRARQSDVAGNVSMTSPALSVVIDTLPPASPLIGTIAPLAISGLAEAGSIVTLLDGVTKLGSTTATTTGTWSIPVTLTPGAHTLVATAMDTAGNSSAAGTVLIGSAGDDVLFTVGPNQALGGLGNDIYVVDDPGDVATEAPGEGFDSIYASLGYALPTDSEIEFIIANAGTAGVALTGNAFANTIFGGAGNDTIAGAAGADVLFGGGGADVFALLALIDSTVDPAGRDSIKDFSAQAGDLIGLAALDANTATGADDVFTFIGNAAFTAAGQVRAVLLGGMTVVLGNVNTDLGADFSVQLPGSHMLNGSNFVL